MDCLLLISCCCLVFVECCCLLFAVFCLLFAGLGELDHSPTQTPERQWGLAVACSHGRAVRSGLMGAGRVQLASNGRRASSATTVEL
eukprot:14924405-Alexandrium_andersonii.AAC.1